MTLEHQGKSRALQKQIFTEYYKELANAKELGKKVVYTFIPGNLCELVSGVFDCIPVYPEINALQSGMRKKSEENILVAERAGYSSDVCAYVKNDIGMMLKGNIGPAGERLPKPDMLLLSYTGCFTFMKWFEALREYYGNPKTVMLHVPFMSQDKPEDGHIRYVVRQLEDSVIPELEGLTGKKYDEDRLRQALKNSAKAEDLWVDILNSPKHDPVPFDAFFEAVYYMSPIFVRLRGTEECVKYYETALEEINERIRNKIGCIPEIKLKFVIDCPPPWSHFNEFWEMFKKWNACSVASTYSKVGGFWDTGLRHDSTRPLESLAEYCSYCYTNQNLDLRFRYIKNCYHEFNADGVVFNSVKSCDAFSMGLQDIRNRLDKEGIPTLFLESDLVDPRYFSGANIRTKIDAFCENL